MYSSSAPRVSFHIKFKIDQFETKSAPSKDLQRRGKVWHEKEEKRGVGTSKSLVRHISYRRDYICTVNS